MKKNIRTYTVIGVAIIIVVAIVWLIGSNYFYSLRIEGGGSPQISAVLNTGEVSPLTTFFGIALVPRSTEYLEVKSVDTITRSTITQRPLLGYVEKTIKLEPQKQVSKIGREGLGCVVQNKSGNFTYKCSGANNFIRHPDLDKKFSWNNPVSSSVVPGYFWYERYKDGVLSAYYWGSTEEKPSDKILVRYTTPDKGVVNQAVLKDIPYSTDDKMTLYTDSAAGDGFLINNITSGKLYYYTKPTSTPIVLERNAVYNTVSDQVFCSVNAGNVVCYYGAASYSPDSEDEVANLKETKKQRKDSSGMFDYYKLDENTSTRQSYYSKQDGVDSICVINSSIYTTSAGVVSRYNLESHETPRPAVFDRSAVYVQCGKTNVLYSTKNSVYSVVGDDSRLVFSSDRFNISTLWSFGDTRGFSVYLSGENASVRDINHVYELSLDKNQTDERIESVLPYTLGTKLPLQNIDYTDSTIYIQPSVSVISDHRTGRMVIDQDSVKYAEQLIRKKLQSDNIGRFKREVILKIR